MSEDRNGIDTLLLAAHFCEENPHSDKNNLHHEYAKPMPEKVDVPIQKERGRDVARERRNDQNQVFLVPKERQRPGGRMEHNRLEKDRRDQLKLNFSKLKAELPAFKDKKTSNQAILKASHKQIMQLKAAEKRLQRQIQDLAKQKGHLQKDMAKAKEVFEQRSGFDADSYLKSVCDATGDDQASLSTESASENEDHRNEGFDVEDDTCFTPPMGPRSRSQMLPPPTPSTPSASNSNHDSNSSPRGIPHSVIRQAPPVAHQRQIAETQLSVASPQPPVPTPPPTPCLSPTPTAIPRDTAKKLQAKLTSSKQSLAQDSPRTTRHAPPATSSQPVVGARTALDSFVCSQGLTPNLTRVATNEIAGTFRGVPVPQTRIVGQSLLPPSPLGSTSLVPAFFPPHAAPSTSSQPIVVPVPVQTNSAPRATALLSGPIPRLGRGGNMRELYSHPQIITVSPGDGMPVFVGPRPLILVSHRPLRPAATAAQSTPPVSSHVNL